MNAFDEGRVGLLAASMANFTDSRLAKVPSALGGLFTDVFLPISAKLANADKVRATVRADGTHLKAHLWADPHDATAPAFTAAVVDKIVELKPGVVELDIEERPAVGRTGQVYTDYIAEVIWRLRVAIPDASGNQEWLRRIPISVNIAPNKGVFLPREWFGDANIYWTEQCYYGDMSRYSEAEALLDLIGRGIPRERARITYGASTEPRGPDGKYLPISQGGKRHPALPTIFYEGRVVAKLSRGLVFSDDLMADVGWL